MDRQEAEYVASTNGYTAEKSSYGLGLPEQAEGGSGSQSFSLMFVI